MKRGRENHWLASSKFRATDAKSLVGLRPWPREMEEINRTDGSIVGKRRRTNVMNPTFLKKNNAELKALA